MFAFGGASLDHQPRAPIAYFLMFQAQQPAVGATNAKLDAIAGDLAGAGPCAERPCTLGLLHMLSAGARAFFTSCQAARLH